jgi:DnaJ-class molecular chaperone
MQNYYDILGVGEDANADEIKSAYRRLAKQWHPDLNKGNAEAEAKFKQVNEANDTQYDQQRRFGTGGNPFQGFQGHQQGFPGGFHFDFNMGPGGMGFEDVFNQFFGQGFRQQPARNRDFQFTLNITLEEAYQGKTMPINFEAAGASRNLTVNIPAGVSHGTRLRFSGHGDRTHANQPPGDLYVIVMIHEHSLFHRDGPHLLMELQLDALDAMLGKQHTVRTIDGSNISVTIPPGTQHGAKLRVPGQGMQVQNHSRQRGDLYMDMRITVPSDLSAEHMDQLRDMRDQRSKR